MTATLLVVLLVSSARAAAPAPPPPASAPAVHASTATPVPAPVALPPALGVSTYTVATLYTGDRVRDPFQAGSGAPLRVREQGVPLTVDIHGLQLRGILKDSSSDFALFKTEDGMSLVLRGGRLYDDSKKAVPGVTGRIQIKQKRAELITEDKDVQVYTLGETDDEGKDKNKP